MDWTQRVAALAEQLTADGKLTSAQWRAALCAVPRHELVPEIYLQDDHRQWRPAQADTEQWWDLVYSDTTVLTSVLPNPLGGLAPVSSSTKPGLMLRMLETLDIRDGMRVLEIGTGSGYNAALLCARLGAEHVFSVDLRPELVERARDRLARLGYRPTLAARDGAEGLAEHAPYDRIIVTCGIPFIPTAWITQLASGGVLLVDLEGPLSAGNLIALHRDTVTEQLHGRFLPWFGRFLPMRHDTMAAGYHLRAPDPDTSAPPDTGWTTVDPSELDREFRLLAQLHLPSGTFHTLTAAPAAPRPTHTRLVSPDGSWCEAARESSIPGGYAVRQAGTQRLWDTVEAAHHQWRQLGEPAWFRFGVTATPASQHMWLDDPDDSPHHWPLWTPVG
ncbi:MAG: methyltransferase domain-containing protein [Gammaproteobacteria bacterium]